MQINKVYSESINHPYPSTRVFSPHILFFHYPILFSERQRKGPKEVFDHQKMFLRTIVEIKHLFENVFEDMLLISNAILVQNTIAS